MPIFEVQLDKVEKFELEVVADSEQAAINLARELMEREPENYLVDSYIEDTATLLDEDEY